MRARADNFSKNAAVPFREFLSHSLFWSTTGNVLVVNGFAVFYTLNLGPERRAYLAAVFAITLITHTLLLQGPGLRLRNAVGERGEAAESLRGLLVGVIFSIPLFLLVLVIYNYVQNSFPNSLFLASCIYFFSTITIFAANELLLYQQNVDKVRVNEFLGAFGLFVSFPLFYYMIKTSLAVSVLLAFASTYFMVALTTVNSLPKSLLRKDILFIRNKKGISRFKKPTLKNMFVIVFFSNSLERLDKVIIAFIVDPSLFAKFTFNIAPLLLLRYVPSLLSKLTVARRLERAFSLTDYAIIFLASLVIGTGSGLLMGITLLRIQGGIWFIGFVPILAFVVYESLRVVYSLVLAQDITNSKLDLHNRISMIGLFVFPVIFLVCLSIDENGLPYAYSLSALFLISVLVSANLPKLRSIVLNSSY